MAQIFAECFTDTQMGIAAGGTMQQGSISRPHIRFIFTPFYPDDFSIYLRLIKTRKKMLFLLWIYFFVFCPHLICVYDERLTILTTDSSDVYEQRAGVQCNTCWHVKA